MSSPQSSAWKGGSLRHAVSVGTTPLFCGTDRKVRGTGFWLSSSKGKENLYLITAYHVLKQPGPWVAQLHLLAEGGDAVSSTVHSLTFHVPNDVLYCPTADLAAIRVKEQLPDHVFYKRFVRSNIACPEDKEFWEQVMGIGTPVEMAGYPGGVIDNHNNVPVFRFGRLAFDPQLGWSGEHLGVTDMGVYPADSGAPVYWTGLAETVVGVGGGQSIVKVFDDIKLIGVHIGGFDREDGSAMALGVFVKACVLYDGFASWKPMAELKDAKFVHPHRSQSQHRLHDSHSGVLNMTSLLSEPKLIKTHPLDNTLQRIIGDSSLIEKGVGRKWRFKFQDSVLVQLQTESEVFSRCDKFDTFEMGDCPDHPMFLISREDGMYDCIFLVQSYEKPRSDGVIVSGFECFDMEHGSKVPDAPMTIAWKLCHN